jgi:uncharacterized protein (TIGR04255 family)
MNRAMHEVKAPLPDFADPPVVEVALSVQIEPLAQLSTQDLAVYWLEVLGKDNYKWREAVAIPSAFEWFGIPQQPPSIEFSVQHLETPPPHRALFLNPDETHLLQLQRDRFVRNWRKGREPYPRYEFIRTSFREQFERLCKFIEDRKLGSCVPNQCEVTYVNHIPWGRDGQPSENLSEVITMWTAETSDSFLGKPEQVDLAARYVITDAGRPIGRLHVAANPRYRADDLQPILALTLTARGRPEEGMDGMMKFMELGHEQIVRGFASITTLAMHKKWGRRA